VIIKINQTFNTGTQNTVLTVIFWHFSKARDSQSINNFTKKWQAN